MGYNGPQPQMKKTLLLALAMFFTTASFAQQQLATLNHNDSITVFYGIDALISAHNAAVSGDIITLSSGFFNSVNITKAVSIRGAGAWQYNGNAITVLQKSFKINIANDSTHHLTLEGLYAYDYVFFLKVYNPQFIKCHFAKFNYGSVSGVTPVMQNATFINCIVESWTSSPSSSTWYAQGTHFINSVILHSYLASSTSYLGYNSPDNFTNCIVEQMPYHEATNARMFQNCILYYEYPMTANESTSYLSNNSQTAFNCIFVQTNNNSSYISNLFSNTAQRVLWNKRGMNAVFKNFNGTYNGIDFELLDTIANTCLGTDGTQVGIYGGFMPFDPRVTNPMIRSINVGQRSTPDGKLAVDIEVVSEETQDDETSNDE